MRSQQPSQYDVIRLYGTSALVLLPFGAIYVYSVRHGVNPSVSFGLCFAVGVILALVVWHWLEAKLARQPGVLMNFETGLVTGGNTTIFVLPANINTGESGSAIMRKGVASPAGRAA